MATPGRPVRDLKVTVEGAEALARKLDPDRLYAHPVEAMLAEGVRYGEQRAQERAPRGTTGQLWAGVGSELHAEARPMYGLVTLDAVSSRGFKYGFALNASPRFHYRAGGRRGGKSGRPTKGWFSKVLPLVRAYISRLRRNAESEIERNFATIR